MKPDFKKSMNQGHKNYSWMQLVVFGLVFSLFLIWSMPGTIALRNFLFGLLFVTTLYVSLKGRFENLSFCKVAKLGWVQFTILASLSGWILFAASWTREGGLVLSELRGQWLIPLLYYAVGYFLVFAFPQRVKNCPKFIFRSIFFAGAVLVSLSVVLGVVFYLQTGDVPFIVGSSVLAPQIVWSKFEAGETLAGSIVGESPDKFSMVVFLYMCLLLSELVYRLISGGRFLPAGKKCFWWLLFVGLAAQYLNRSRHGNVVFAACLVVFFLIFIYEYPARIKIRKGWIIVCFVVIAPIVASVFVKSDNRWRDLIETVPLALDSNNKAWLYRNIEDYPLLNDGRRVDASNYERVAWAKEGASLIFHNPLGLGYNRNAFGDAVDEKYKRGGLNRGGHSHSGIIDFTIANGLPGLFLWLMFILSICILGLKELKHGNKWLGALVLIYVSGFLLRSVLDSVLRDHYLQQFMFISGLLVGFVLKNSYAKNGVRKVQV